MSAGFLGDSSTLLVLNTLPVVRGIAGQDPAELKLAEHIQSRAA